MIAAGYLNAVPTEEFSLRLFNGLQRFQADNGLIQTGGFNNETIDRLAKAAEPMLRMWRFQEVAHPRRATKIWMPTGMGLRREVSETGLFFTEPSGRISASFNAFDGVPLDPAYNTLLQRILGKGGRVHYKVMKDGWFVISATDADGVDAYYRYHQDRQGTTGFAVFWNNSRGNVSGERIAILMSASLGAWFNGRPFMRPLDFEPQVASRPSVPAPAPTYATPAPVPAPTPEPSKVSTGTGFFVTGSGDFVTNEHVVSSCSDIRVKTSDGKTVQATVAAKDAVNDLALLRMDVKPSKFAMVRGSARLGENVAVFGFPHSDMLATTGNFTTGIITATSGMRDDSRFYQTSAPVQSGNSGGPMLDSYGNVIGVVTAKLNALKVAMQVGDLPQNVNFAVKTSLLTTFLEASGVKTTNAPPDGARLDTPDLADLGKAISGFVACR